MWNGRTIRESAKTGNPKTARQIESARKTELAKGEVGLKDRGPPDIRGVLEALHHVASHGKGGKAEHCGVLHPPESQLRF